MNRPYLLIEKDMFYGDIDVIEVYKCYKCPNIISSETFHKCFFCENNNIDADLLCESCIKRHLKKCKWVHE